MNRATWKGLALLTALLLAATYCVQTQTAEAALSGPEISGRMRATDKALRWLDDQQNADGGFGDGGSDPRTTCEVVLAFASAYEEPGGVQVSGKSPLDYLATQVVTQTNSAEGTALLILAVVAGNEDPRDFASTDLVATLKGCRQPSGRYWMISSDGIRAQALAIMAKSVSWEAVPLDAVVWLKGQQNDDGGWGPLPEEPSDTENTALSIQALIAAGESSGSQPVRDAVLYLRERETEDAGFASSALASTSDPVSTSQAIQALLAAGEDLLSTEWSRCLRSPFDALLDNQTGDGSFESDSEITAAAVPGLVGRSLPLPGRYLSALKALDWLHTQQLNDGGFGNGGITADAVYAIALCGQDPDGFDWTKNDTSALDALEAQTPSYIAGAPGDEPAGELAKIIRAVEAAGGDPEYFATRNLVDELEALYDSGTGRYHPSKIYSHDLAIIALHAASESIHGLAVTTLENAQLPAGGWPWAWDMPTADVDSTGLTLHAIVAGGGPGSAGVLDDAADFLEGLRFPSGGYPDLATRPEPNCDSTSLAIQGLLASGMYRQEPLLFALETGALGSSWDALLAFQEDTGSFVPRASVPGDLLNRLLATVEAVHALASPLYPAYQPLAEGDATVPGTVHGRLTCGRGLGVVAPYSGDDNNDGSASLQYRAVGGLWSEWIEMGKGGLHYVELLDLEVGTEYEIEVSYDDPDLSGQETQSLNLYMGKACIPFAVRSHAG